MQQRYGVRYRYCGCVKLCYNLDILVSLRGLCQGIELGHHTDVLTISMSFRGPVHNGDAELYHSARYYNSAASKA